MIDVFHVDNFIRCFDNYTARYYEKRVSTFFHCFIFKCLTFVLIKCFMYSQYLITFMHIILKDVYYHVNCRLWETWLIQKGPVYSSISSIFPVSGYIQWKNGMALSYPFLQKCSCIYFKVCCICVYLEIINILYCFKTCKIILALYSFIYFLCFILQKKNHGELYFCCPPSSAQKLQIYLLCFIIRFSIKNCRYMLFHLVSFPELFINF